MFRHPDLAIQQSMNLATMRRKQGETRRSLEGVETFSPIVESAGAIPLWLDHFAMLKAKNLTYLLLFEEALQQLGAGPHSSWWEKKKDSARAWSWILLGCPSRALALVPVSRDPRHLVIRAQRQMARAQAYLQLGQFAQARKEAEEALVTLPDYLIYPRTKAHQQMGLVCLAEERIQEALENFESKYPPAKPGALIL